MFVNLWVTTNCNFSCRYCYEGENKENHILQKETVDNLISHIKNELCENEDIIVEFHGGEPLLNFELIKYTIDDLNTIFPGNKKYYGITTNAYYLEDNYLDFISEHMNYNLSISIDGMPEINDKYRVTRNGEGTFTKICDNVKAVLIRRPDSMARMTVTSNTVQHLYENSLFLEEMGFKIIGAALDYYDEGWNEEKIEILYKEMVKLKEYEKVKKRARFPITNFYCKKMRECGFGKKYFTLYPNGDIYPCTYCVGKEEFILGNINGSGFNTEQIKKYQSVNTKANTLCIGCKHIEHCVANRCKFWNYALTGDFLLPSGVACAMENIKQRLSIL